VAGSCEDIDEPSGSIKREKFLDQLSVLLASQEGLCSMGLVVIKQTGMPAYESVVYCLMIMYQLYALCSMGWSTLC
jgi:hypothetical protein